MNELEFLEGLFRDDDKGNELQFFKEPIFNTKLNLVNRIFELREQFANSTDAEGGKEK